VIRRAVCEGFKGGALAHGLATARGELVAIFDADCIPAPDFLLRIVPWFISDPGIAMVQGSWSFINRCRSLLTRAQAAILDGLMHIEQPARSRGGRPFQFNGTAGVWRRSCIEECGGWRAVSIAEDLELSFRVRLRGFRFVHRRDVAVQTELPETFGALRSQQRRWAHGSAQALSLIGADVARGARPAGDRLAMLLHMARRSLHVFLAIWMVSLPLTTFQWMPTLINDGTIENTLLFLLVVLSIGGFLVAAQRRAGVSWLEAIASVPSALGLYLALSFALAPSFLAGLARRQRPFVRTPKLGQETFAAPLRYLSPFDPVAVLESLAGAAYAGFTLLALRRGYFLHASVFAWIAAALGSVGFGSILETLDQPLLRLRRATMVAIARWKSA
jgi:cellulose synthase/poly-beta-1,6-N-acetylglucosamine synthase-like glycosyltransferase